MCHKVHCRLLVQIVIDAQRRIRMSARVRSKKAEAFVKKTQQLYLNALEVIGAKYVDGHIVSTNDNDDNEEKSPVIEAAPSIKSQVNYEMTEEEKTLVSP